MLRKVPGEGRFYSVPFKSIKTMYVVEVNSPNSKQSLGELPLLLNILETCNWLEASLSCLETCLHRILSLELTKHEKKEKDLQY